MDWGDGITTLGTTTLRERKVSFGLKDSDRTKHFAVIGKVGSGRGDLMVAMALQDIARGLGVLFLDATGTSATRLLERIPPGDLGRVIFLDPSDAEYPFTWNVVDDLRTLPVTEQAAVLAQLLREVYQLAPSPFLERVAELMLREQGVSVVTFHSLVTNKKFRDTFFTGHESDKQVFEDELQELPELTTALNEYGKYVGNDTLIRNLLGQRESKFSLNSLNDGSIIIVDLSRIRMYPTRMAPLVKTFIGAARAVVGEAGAGVYLHDTLRYLTETGIEHLLAPRNHCAVTIADTIIQEADIERRLLALSRVGSVASFVPHPADSAVVGRAFSPHVSLEDLLDLPLGEFVAALSIDGVRSLPFFAQAVALSKKEHVSYQDLVVESRRKYATVRTRIDLGFSHRHGGDEDADLMDDDDDVDEGGDGPGEQRNFQDAFRNIFAKQAERAQAAIKPNAPAPSPEPAQAPVKAEPKPEPKPQPSETTSSGEVDETTLKKLVFVAPVAIALFLAPLAALASVTVTEIMYDLPGTDEGREWVEVQNTGTEPLILSEWKLFEADTNHTLTSVMGGMMPPGGYAVIADNSAKFLDDWPGFAGVLYDSAFSLSNTGETLIFKDPTGASVSTASYTKAEGGAGDGATLNAAGAGWAAGTATPGLSYVALPLPPQPQPVQKTTAVEAPKVSEVSDAEITVSAGAAPELAAPSFASYPTPSTGVPSWVSYFASAVLIGLVAGLGVIVVRREASARTGFTISEVR